MNVTLAEAVLLLAYTEEEGKPLIDSFSLTYCLAGAQLADLALAERIDVPEAKVVVTDPAPVGDAELDSVLARIVQERKARAPQWWVQRLASAKLRGRLLERLAGRGALSERRGRVLGVFPTTRWPEADGSIEAEVRERVTAALQGATPDERTAVLIAVLHAVKLDRKAFSGADRKRVKQIAEGEWIGKAVAKTISDITAVIIATSTAGAVAGTSG